MNITLELQELDDLIIKHTASPVTAILRNKLHPLWDQLEGYIAAKEKEAHHIAELEKQLLDAKAQNEKLEAEIARRDADANDDPRFYVM
jgi:septation ring formation regulator EzrA